MNNVPDGFAIPQDVEEQYEGRWIAWDTVEGRVVGAGDTLDDAIRAASEAREADHLIWYHQVLPKDTVLVGCL